MKSLFPTNYSLTVSKDTHKTRNAKSLTITESSIYGTNNIVEFFSFFAKAACRRSDVFFIVAANS